MLLQPKVMGSNLFLNSLFHSHTKQMEMIALEQFFKISCPRTISLTRTMFPREQKFKLPRGTIMFLREKMLKSFLREQQCSQKNKGLSCLGEQPCSQGKEGLKFLPQGTQLLPKALGIMKFPWRRAQISQENICSKLSVSQPHFGQVWG